MGEVVARGRIKVDARKALHKLRDHMLVDPHLYGTELARVAVALSATRLEVSYDTDDVIVTFDGRPLAPGDIQAVRDRVLGGTSHSPDGDALRLLGIAVTAALGLGASFVDVYSASAAGACDVVRFDDRYLDDASSALPTPRRVALPPGLAAPGMRVHVRRKIDLALLGRAVRRQVPPEVALLALACADAPLALTVPGSPRVPVVPARAVILRVDLDVPGATRAVLEVLAPHAGMRAESMFMERGVLLVTEVLEPWCLDALGLPLRVLVDAERLPTNASRSSLRADAELVTRVRAHVPRALEAALDVLRSPTSHPRGAATLGLGLGGEVEVVDSRPEAARDALGALGASVALSVRAGRSVPPAAMALLDLPLLRDAVSAPLTLNDALRLLREPPVTVLRGGAPEDPMLAPWIGGIPLLSGAAAERVFTAEPTVPADALVAQAREGGARRARALAHPASRAVVPRSPPPLLVEAFRVDEGRFAGLEGEISVTRSDAIRRASTAYLFVDERLLEVVAMPGATLPVDVALAWPARFRPRRGYDAVERTNDVEEAVHHALRVAALVIAERLAAKEPALVRMAIEAWAPESRRLGAAAPSALALGVFADAPVWPTTESGRFATLAEIDAYARLTGAVCTGHAGAGRAVDGRPVVDARFARGIVPLLATPVTLVPYAASLGVPDAVAHAAIERAAARMLVKVPFETALVSGVVGVEREKGAFEGAPRLLVHHRGALVHDLPRPSGATVVAEDARAVPAPPGVLGLRVVPLPDLAREEHALLTMVVSQCERGELELASVSRYLREAWLAFRDQDPALCARIEDLPARAARARVAAMRAAFLARVPDASAQASDASDALDASRVKGSVTAEGEGRATAGLPPEAAPTTWAAPPALVLFRGRRLTELPVSLPIVGTVDLESEQYVGADWASLSDEGEAWSTRALTAASVDTVRRAASRARLPNDVALLRLAVALASGAPAHAAPAREVLAQVAWPTVQGANLAVRAHGKVRAGTQAYPMWLEGAEASPHDAPAVHLPESPVGELRRRALLALGCEINDVTASLSRLQAQRARQAHDPPPRLDGSPIAPRLRVTLASLGATLAEGELEITAASGPEVVRVDRAGAAQPLELASPLPVRVVFRAEDRDVAACLWEIAASAEQHVLRLVANADDAEPLPAVMAAARILLCAKVARREPPGALEVLPLFPDTAGTARSSLVELRGADVVRVITDPPPYPRVLLDSPALFLWPSEKAALSGVVTFEDVTAAVREAAEGERRRAAPPLARLELAAHVRGACLFTETVAEGQLRGEIGLLAPSHAGLRGVDVHHTMRPLVRLSDGNGWPLVAVVDDGAATPTASFTGLARLAGDAGRILGVLRAYAARRLATFLEAPAGALGVLRLPIPFFAGRARVPCLGVFWLDAAWPERPEVHLEAIGYTDPFLVPCVLPEDGAHSVILPVRGRLLVACERAGLGEALGAVFRHVKDRLGPSVAAAARPDPRRPPPEVLAAYAWDLCLLGVRLDRSPVRELARDRPDEMLLRVVARRAPRLLRIEATPPLAVVDSVDSADAAAGAGLAREAKVHVDVDVVPAPAAVPVAAAPEPTSMFSGIVRRVVELASRPPVPATTELTRALEGALAAMKLSGDPVAEVREVSRGRPIRFDRASRVLIVNGRHEAVGALAGHPPGVLLLLASAVSEVNRELETVTDAEELNVITSLLA